MNHPQSIELWRETAEVHNGNVTEYLSSKSEVEEISRGSSLVVIVDQRALERECLARGLLEQDPNLSIFAVGSLDEFHNTQPEADTAAVLAILGGRKVTDPNVRAELVRFVSDVGVIPVIVVADSDEPAEILAALECGAKGYIPTSVKLRVAAEAIGLARAGGIFVPASSLLALREAIHASANTPRPLSGLFTSREAAVVEALRKGKANKIIAYELNLCESTVKVHIRNIMKKLKATNRTEVAYKLREMVL
jgi:DNA-binding NarL/FixJ family response regulator